MMPNERARYIAGMGSAIAGIPNEMAQQHAQAAQAALASLDGAAPGGVVASAATLGVAMLAGVPAYIPTAWAATGSLSGRRQARRKHPWPASSILLPK